MVKLWHSIEQMGDMACNVLDSETWTSTDVRIGRVTTHREIKQTCTNGETYHFNNFFDGFHDAFCFRCSSDNLGASSISPSEPIFGCRKVLRLKYSFKTLEAGMIMGVNVRCIRWGQKPEQSQKFSIGRLLLHLHVEPVSQ